MHCVTRLIFTLFTIFTIALILDLISDKEIDNYICGKPDALYEPTIERWRITRKIYNLPLYKWPWGIARGLLEGNLSQHRYFPNYLFEPREQLYGKK
jgi:hypothetical protein